MANVETRQVERDSLLLIAQVRIDGGDGFDTLTVIGTELMVPPLPTVRINVCPAAGFVPMICPVVLISDLPKLRTLAALADWTNDSRASPAKAKRQVRNFM